jgi:3,4-dihydroxy 2-butanone 4-phosphate synthase/GTP cyclohydrolase II
MVPPTAVPEAIAAIGRGDAVVLLDDDPARPAGALIIGADGDDGAAAALVSARQAGLVLGAVVEVRGVELEADHTDAPTRSTGARGRGNRARDPDGAPLVTGVIWARAGGVLDRPGTAEAAVDLTRLAGCRPAALVAEGPGDAAAWEQFAADHGLAAISVADLVRHRWRTEVLVRRVAEARIPTAWGDFTAYAYENVISGDEHLAFVMGSIAGKPNVLVRVHSECLTGDVFGSLKCDCGTQLAAAMDRIASEGQGVLVYLRGHEGRGIGITHKLRAYALQDQGLDTVDANIELGLPVDNREYGVGAQILVDLGITTMRYMTNNPAKYGGIEGFGLEMAERVAIETAPTPQNIAYLRAKKERMGHLIDLGEVPKPGA